MKSETCRNEKKNIVNSPIQEKQRVSDVTVDTVRSRFSGIQLNYDDFQNCPILQNNCHYRRFFEQKVKQQEISTSLHKKSINWLISFCWTRNYSSDILWFSIGYYYAYIYSHPVKKQRLTPLLMTTVNLSLKLHSPNQVLSFGVMKSLLNNKWEINDFKQLQWQIVTLFKFDLYFPILLNRIYEIGMDQEEIAKTLFIYELLFFKNYEAAINHFLLDDIIDLVKCTSTENNVKQQIIKIGLNSKIIEMVKNKYESKFKVGQFLQEISLNF